MLFAICFLAAAVNAAVVQVHKARDARPGSPVVRQAAVESSSVALSSASSPIAPAISSAPLPLADGPEPCMPKSICFDGRLSCGIRYGGCYDANFCNGLTTSFPVPTCPPATSTSAEAAASSTDMSDPPVPDAPAPARHAVPGILALEQELDDGSAQPIVIHA